MIINLNIKINIFFSIGYIAFLHSVYDFYYAKIIKNYGDFHNFDLCTAPEKKLHEEYMLFILLFLKKTQNPL